MKKSAAIEPGSVVIPTGRAGRALRLALATPFLAALPVALLAQFSALEGVAPIRWFAVVMLLLVVWLWMRLPFTGVKAERGRLIVRSWWTTRSFDRATIAQFSAEEYFGGLEVILPWLATSRVAVERRSGEHISLGGTFSSGASVRGAVASLNYWIGIDPGPRRARRTGAANSE